MDPSTVPSLPFQAIRLVDDDEIWRLRLGVQLAFGLSTSAKPETVPHRLSGSR
jgi:hypothetical protein